MKDTPTSTEYLTLDDAYDQFNRHLWGGKLPGCIITLEHSKRFHGYFSANRFASKIDIKKKTTIHQIALNAQSLDRTDAEILSTLAHEMAHLWQQEFGKPGRGKYHNTEWANEMRRIGLEPESENGKGTGQKVSHSITPGGLFSRFCNDLIIAGTKLHWAATPTLAKARNAKQKTAYVCPECELKVWGKPGLKLECLDCETIIEEQPV